MVQATLHTTKCYHCGDSCAEDAIEFEEKIFCCDGCLAVHKVLLKGGMSDYYEFEQHPGTKRTYSSQFDFLENEQIVDKLVRFKQGSVAKLQLHIPAIHCTSCVWLLENLDQLHEGVMSVRVIFLQKKADITIDTERITVKELAELLSKVGYEPRITLEAEDQQKENTRSEHKLITKLAVAGFCFGNVMLFSFPEYFGLNMLREAQFARFFGALNLILCLPAIFYSGIDYITSAFKAVRNRNLHLNVPLAIGMLALFGRTSYEILAGVGAGYGDSLTGLIFFLLVGKWFQQKTYDHLSFERDYKSYFPLAVLVQNGENWGTKPLSEVEKGDRLKIRNGELIPVDGILLHGQAEIDYSFVTGESVPVSKGLGEVIYAGGRQTGPVVEIEALRTVGQSHLTQLWNSDGEEENEGITSFADKIGKYFTIFLLIIATLTFTFWAFTDISLAFFAFTSVLIVACPCALALSSPFALGNAMRVLGRTGLYLKRYSVVEDLSQIDRIVFDKTGTLTTTDRFDISYEGDDLKPNEWELIRGLVANSNHPFSKAIYTYLKEYDSKTFESVSEHHGLGLIGSNGDKEVKLGSASFVRGEDGQSGTVHFEISNGPSGKFVISNHYRHDVAEVTDKLAQKGYQLSLLSGDGDMEAERIRTVASGIDRLVFNADPIQKKQEIEKQSKEGEVLMIGDGLNDAGALKNAKVGFVVTDDTNNFTPAADGILLASSMKKLPEIMQYAKRTMGVIRWSLIYSLIYNSIGIFFAVQGVLSPVIAAILMPLSSITVVVMNTTLTNLIAKRFKLI